MYFFKFRNRRTILNWWCIYWTLSGERGGRWPSGGADVSEPGGPGFDSSSWQPQVVAHQHWTRWTLSIEHVERWIEHTGLVVVSTPSLVLCCAWLVTMALHVHCGLGQLDPLPTSGDDKWVAAKHCRRAKRSRISDTHRLRSSLQFRFINNQSLHFTFYQWTSSHTSIQYILCIVFHLVRTSVEKPVYSGQKTITRNYNEKILPRNIWILEASL